MSQKQKPNVGWNYSKIVTAKKKYGFPRRSFSVNPEFLADLVIFTEEILNGKLPFYVQRVYSKATNLLQLFS